METNQNLHHWIKKYYKENPIPEEGNWEDVSGETFLRNLLTRSIEATKHPFGIDPMYVPKSNVEIGVDPRSVASRIMDIRQVLAKEWIEDLASLSEENGILLKESFMASLEKTFDSDGESSIDEDDEISGVLKEEWEARIEKLNVAGVNIKEQVEEQVKEIVRDEVDVEFKKIIEKNKEVDTEL
eukprot:CAMPEP_0196579880 /NCGR_PEP_ID=MMETSP1081-20130531/25474_1 /TAXON_ID=36882 /ORGANISM="Pyramimonas amylifera, Strain CCMP720" /LENGTH=183 /DNA_ID=CAMNT_0041899593 /DNA_START=399 /DNA_END=950 /DNA_ORIENTATION=+